ncbi:NEDD4-binding protein 2 [Gonapodya sp. JEL0774]|nr:NEDD4-binding protein 2 [Gonapodya sp. JEL0774]
MSEQDSLTTKQKCQDQSDLESDTVAPGPSTKMNGDLKSVERPLPGMESVMNVPAPPDGTQKRLVIVRGAPGSGKSTLAQSLVTPGGIALSTDDYFLVPSTLTPVLLLPTPPIALTSNPDVSYAFDSNLLGQAHAWNQERCRLAITRGLTPIVIDNTNTQRWEARPYVEAATTSDATYRVEFCEPDTPWWKARDVEEMAKRNSHGVPFQAIRGMVERWEEGPWTIEEILDAERPQFVRRDRLEGGDRAGRSPGHFGRGRGYSTDQGRTLAGVVYGVKINATFETITGGIAGGSSITTSVSGTRTGGMTTIDPDDHTLVLRKEVRVMANGTVCSMPDDIHPTILESGEVSGTGGGIETDAMLVGQSEGEDGEIMLGSVVPMHAT